MRGLSVPHPRPHLRGILWYPPSTVRTLVTVLLVVFVVVVTVAWLASRGPGAVQAARIAAVLESTSPVDEPAAYAHCASCHLHDGSGRPDGSIPRLAGQRRAVLENKLYRLRAGITRLPVMEPFARTLAPVEIAELSEYLSQLPVTESSNGPSSEEVRDRGQSLYAQHCLSCHGVNGEGHDGLFASRLCGQYAGYLNRRLDEVLAETRGDADAIMRDAIDEVPLDDLRAIVAWLAAGKGCPSP
jgi:cytochrome c553